MSGDVAPEGMALGLVAGSGRLPFALARAARSEGHRVVAVGHIGATDPSLESEVDLLSWVRVGQLKKTALALRTAGVTQAIFGGGLAKGKALRAARPDFEALKLWAGLRDKGDDRLLRAIADWFGREGIAIVEATGLLRGCFAERGLIAGPKPTSGDLEEAARGLELCRRLGEHDIGQTVALREGMVLAVEAMEGTDACIERAGQILDRAVIVKALKPGQDRRFDLPTVGPGTLEVMEKARARLLAIEAGVTLVLEREEIRRLAKRARISVVGI
jgi:UDP-2,3-diacylglucosamine hydrolase